MSDDLVKRARDCANGLGDTKTDRGDLGIFDDLADRIEELEVRLAKAVEALELLHDNVVQAWPSIAYLGPVANASTTLAAVAEPHKLTSCE